MAEGNGSRPERLVKFEVCGQEYSLHTSAPEREVEEILTLVKTQFEGLNRANPRLLTDKMAVLTCLNMAGDLIRLRHDFESFKRRSRENIGRLIKKIETSIGI